MMRKELKMIGLFFIVVVVIVLILNYTYTHTILKQTMPYKKEIIYNDYITKNNQSINYLFLGDSHPANDIIPELVDVQSFNYAGYAESYMVTYYKLRKVVKYDNVNITTAVLEADRLSFSPTMDKSGIEKLQHDILLYHQYISYSELKKSLGKRYIQLFISIHFPFVGIGPEVLEYLYASMTNNIHDVNQNGNVINENVMSSETDNSEKRVKEIYSYSDVLSPYSINYYTKTLHFCKENNIRVILMIYPVSKTYDEVILQYNITSRGEHYSQIYSLTQKEIGTFCIIDYYDFFWNNMSYMADSDHLNTAGAKVLSEQLKKDLINIENDNLSKNHRVKCYS